jgi:hypothetical protein
METEVTLYEEQFLTNDAGGHVGVEVTTSRVSFEVVSSQSKQQLTEDIAVTVTGPSAGLEGEFNVANGNVSASASVSLAKVEVEAAGASVALNIGVGVGFSKKGTKIEGKLLIVEGSFDPVEHIEWQLSKLPIHDIDPSRRLADGKRISDGQDAMKQALEEDDGPSALGKMEDAIHEYVP